MRLAVQALDAALSIFESDRVWLLHPCDPEAPAWTVPWERTRKEYPGALQEPAVLPMQPEAADVLRGALESDGPVAYDARSGRPLPVHAAERFSIRSQVVMAVHPRLGQPWLLGMHQCSHARVWSDVDLRLFHEIGRRLTDALSSTLLLQNLRASETKHKLLIEATGTGYVILDAEGRLTDANQEYLRLTGYRALEEILGRRMSEWTCPEERERLAEALERCLEQGLVRDLELQYLAPGGRVTPVEINAARLATPAGDRIMAVGRDITERRRAEDELRLAARRKDEFLAMLGHELRNPIAPIRNGVALLQRIGSPDPRAERARGIIERQTLHLARIIDDLLDVSRIARGKVVLRREPLDWTSLVSDAVEDARADIEAKGVALEAQLPEDRVWVEGDRTRLAQVLSNLLHNAQKFTEPGGTLRVALHHAPGAGVASLTVADTGIGMEPATLERLFEPFVQADVGLARSRGGLGLGLALVKGLVLLHGGTVAAASDGLGKGSRVTVQLPVIAAPAMRPPAAGAGPGLRRLRVLVVEDNRDAAESLRALLELMGHEVRTAGDGLSGLRQARAFRPEAILCDLGLPGDLDGYAVAAAVRADPLLRGVLLAAVSGYGRLEDKLHCAQARFDLHLTKPVEPAELERVLGERGAQLGPLPA